MTTTPVGPVKLIVSVTLQPGVDRVSELAERLHDLMIGDPALVDVFPEIATVEDYDWEANYG